MGKLYLVGVGLYPDLITLRALKVLRDVDVVYLEGYTSTYPGDLRQVMELVGRELRVVDREFIERRFEEVIEELREKNVAIAVVGDPLVATTHIANLVEVRRRGFEFEVIPGVGIIPNALTMAGLMIYKMGKVVTLMRELSRAELKYVYDVIADNDLRNLHTVVLLEFNAEEGVVMNVGEAVEKLLEAEKSFSKGVIREDRLAVAVSALGSPKARICPGRFSELRGYSYVHGPHTLIVVSPKPHFMEEEALEVVRSEFCR